MLGLQKKDSSPLEEFTLMILFMVPMIFATILSFKCLIIFSLSSIFSPRCPTVLEEGRKGREETIYWPRNQYHVGVLNI